MNDSTSVVGTGKGNMIWGILMLICGFLAIGLPFASGIGVAIVIGWVLLVTGVWPLLFGFRSGSGIGGFLWQLLLAIVYGSAGLMLLFRPLAGLAASHPAEDAVPPDPPTSARLDSCSTLAPNHGSVDAPDLHLIYQSGGRR